MDSNQGIGEGCHGGSENLAKLRELIEILDPQVDDTEYQKAAAKISEIVESGKRDIRKAKNAECKLRCYESLFASISAILTGIKNYV